MGTCFESESIKLLQLQIFCITFTAFPSSFMSFIILHHLYFKRSHAPFKFICGSYYTGWQGAGGGGTITHYADFLIWGNQRSRNEKKGQEVGVIRKSLFTCCENSKSCISLLCPITPHAANVGPITHHADNLGPVTHHADNLGPITRHGKPLCHPDYK